MQKIGILDFGGQYAHLIANRVRRLGVYSEVLSPTIELSELSKYNGLIFSGGPASVYNETINFNKDILNFDKPILGICYGHQLISHTLGGEVKAGKTKEYGKASVIKIKESSLFDDLNSKEIMWMSHGDEVNKLPDNFEVIAKTDDCPVAAVRCIDRPIYGLQFHPEVTHSKNGLLLLKNFLKICQCSFSWSIKNYLEESIKNIRQIVKDKKVFLLVSGGVDSNVAFSLLNKALGDEKVYGLHIDNGLMRLDESEWVKTTLNKYGFTNFHIINSEKDFLKNLTKLSDPQEKRKTIGNTFLDVKCKETSKLGLNDEEWLLGQGTIYPDTIESGGTENSSIIKTHHNRVDRIQELINQGKIIEPLADLYKDEVRELGELLGLPHELVWRHPFPGPGLGVRILCSNKSVQEDFSELESQINAKVNDAKFNVRVLPIKSVGVQGDARTYANPCVLEGEGDWQELQKVSILITNNFPEINRVVYNLSKPLDKKIYLKEAYTTKKRCDLLRQIDNINYEILEDLNLYEDIWQMPVVLLPLADIKGKESIILRPINSTEAMTATFAHLPQKFLSQVTENILGNKSISNLFYDITNKPPGTIEWE